MSTVKYLENGYKNAQSDNPLMALFSKAEREKIYTFHKSMGADYTPTPLVKLDGLAAHMGISEFYVKDESQRHPLKAFKLLGGSYAVACIICDMLKVKIEDVDFDYLKSDVVKQKLGNLVFAAASDGNHGRSVAFAANRFNQGCVIYMPKGTAVDRIKNIEALGATVVVADGNYDFCGREVSRLSEEKGWVIVPDTASEGDPKIARNVMKGYLTMATEIIGELSTAPTHVFLQAGVGSMAATMLAAIKLAYSEAAPQFFIVEPHKANCFYQSGKVGKAVSVDGDLDSMMAGLSCGVPSPDGWEIIRDFAQGFISCDDLITANGMRILANPIAGDNKVVAGESGAVGTGLVEYMCTNEPTLCAQLGLNKNARVLVISTEGDTDTENYRNVVWYGKSSL
jgi:diaminopropionate ammonia-lyase